MPNPATGGSASNILFKNVDTFLGTYISGVKATSAFPLGTNIPSKVGPILGITNTASGHALEVITNLSAGMFSGNLTTMFFLIGKDNRVNANSLLGYYADVRFVNDSREKIELFSVGSEVSESSK